MNKLELSVRVTLGSLALIAWLAFFSVGLLIDSGKYRRHLTPQASTTALTAESQLGGKTVEEFHGSTAQAFGAAIICYTPTNLLFLTLLAGLLGGCSSNVRAQQMENELKSENKERLMYLEESPWSAMVRSFVVYMCVIAGLYVVIDDPFKNPTAAQYMRLAGTMSMAAFVVGYDPTQIRRWIGIMPGPPNRTENT
jgi:hypothetical protein